MKKVLSLLFVLVVLALALTLSACDTHEHSYIANVTYATCTEPGSIIYICECGATGAKNEIEPKGHTEVVDEAVASTCTTTGLTEGKHCSACGEILVAQKETSLAGHTEEIIPAVESTCTEHGLTEGKKCSVCEVILVPQVEAPLKAHTYDNDEDATCNECGYERYCVHHNTVTLEAKAPTCTRTGLTEGKQCVDCQEILIAQEVLSMLEHDYATVTVTDPTCENQGYTTYTCVCGAFYIDTYVAATGHIFSDWIIVKEATVTEEGLKERYCDCGEKETEIIEKLTNELEYTLNSNGQGYTVTGIGTCTDTEIVIPDTYKGLPVTAIGASAFIDCTSITSVVINANIESIGARAFLGCTSLVNVVMPENMTWIGRYAFENCTALKTVVIPEGFEWCGEWTFYSCTSLETIYLPSTTRSLDAQPIAGCSSITTINYNGTIAQWNSITIYGSLGDSNTGDYTIYCTDGYIIKDGTITYYQTVSEGLEYKLNADGASYSATGIGDCTDTDIIIPDTYEGLPVTAIGQTAFLNCNQIETIFIPDSVVMLDYLPFAFCTSLVSIEVSETHPYLVSINGDLYYKSNVYPETEMILLQYALGKGDTNFTLPDGVSHIFPGAFATSQVLEEIVITDGVVYIEYATFTMITSLKKITLPASLAYLGPAIMEESVAVETIAYNGTIEQWNSFKKDRDWNLSSSNYTIFCTDGKIEKNGTITYYQTVSEGLEFALNIDEKSYYVKGIGTCTDTDIVIPNEYNGLPVTSIGNSAFTDCTSLTSIVIPDPVTSIGIATFYNCSSLTSVTFGENSQLTSLGYLAFSTCKALTSINIPNLVTSIGPWAFFDCTSLTSIKIPNTVTSIGKYAFEDCTSLTSINIPNSVTNIGYSVFLDCSKLTIYCEAESQPDGWDSNWNPHNRPVVWGYKPY